MEELLSMELGDHVLDAFNIPFVNFLDNVIFATVIDLVGKYQLEMQKVFSYAPMARSMGPMLSEEGFHIGSGRGFLKEMAVGATNDTGRYSIEDIQRALNAWVPRGVEMFGNERGGGTAVQFGFKDRDNGTAQGEYYNEVRELIELINVEIVKTKLGDISAPDARVLVREVQDTGETVRNVAPGRPALRPRREVLPQARRRGDRADAVRRHRQSALARRQAVQRRAVPPVPGHGAARLLHEVGRVREVPGGAAGTPRARATAGTAWLRAQMLRSRRYLPRPAALITTATMRAHA